MDWRGVEVCLFCWRSRGVFKAAEREKEGGEGARE
jgi:hypothetical protein